MSGLCVNPPLKWFSLWVFFFFPCLSWLQVLRMIRQPPADVQRGYHFDIQFLNPPVDPKVLMPYYGFIAGIHRQQANATKRISHVHCSRSKHVIIDRYPCQGCWMEGGWRNARNTPPGDRLMPRWPAWHSGSVLDALTFRGLDGGDTCRLQRCLFWPRRWYLS